MQGRVKRVPQHYLIEHGSVQTKAFDFLAFVADPLQYATDFIVGHNIEGIVFHCSGGRLYKINQGHIGRDAHGPFSLAVCADLPAAAA